MRTIHRTTIAVATIALALTACGSDAGSEAGSEGTGTAAESSESADAVDQATGEADTDAGPAEQTTEVAIDDFRFLPGNNEVAVGDTVTWSNEDATAHTVTAGTPEEPDNERFDMRVDEQGQTVEVTFDEAGTYQYFCAIHPFMTAAVTVTG